MHDASAARLPSFPAPAQPQEPSTLATLLIDLIGREKGHPVNYRDLRRDVARTMENQPDVLIRSAIGRLVAQGAVLELDDDEFFLTRNLQLVERRICEILAAYHATYPFAPGVATGEVKKRFSKGKTLNARRNIDPRLFERAMAACKERAEVTESSDGLRLAQFSLSEEQRENYARLERELVACVGDHRYYTLDLDTMAARLGVDAGTARVVLAGLLKTQQLVKYGDDRYLEGAVMNRIKSALAQELQVASRMTIGEIKNLLDIPRNAIIPLMEYLDDTNFTRRDGNDRMLARGR